LDQAKPHLGLTELAQRTGKLDHERIGNAVVREIARSDSSLAIGNSLKECGPLNR